jgi:hypothetical protein
MLYKSRINGNYNNDVLCYRDRYIIRCKSENVGPGKEGRPRNLEDADAATEWAAPQRRSAGLEQR